MEQNNSNEYWFHKYDEECFTKDFQRISYMSYVYQLSSDPFFKTLQDKPCLSTDTMENCLQQLYLNIYNHITQFFQVVYLSSQQAIAAAQAKGNNNDNLSANNSVSQIIKDNQQDPDWVLFMKVIIGYLDCEKLYYIMFWPVYYIKGFILKRIMALYVRLQRFLVCLQINVIAFQQASKQSDRLRLAIARAQPEQLYVQKQQLQDLIKKIEREIEKAEKLLKSDVKHQTVTLDDELLMSKLKHYCQHFFDQCCFDLKNESDLLFERAETRVALQIMIHNDNSIKKLDLYLEKGNFEFKDIMKEEESIYNNSEELKAISDLVDQTFKIEAEEKKEELKKLNLARKKKKKPTNTATGGMSGFDDQRNFVTGQTLSTEANDDYSEETIYDQQADGSSKLIEALRNNNSTGPDPSGSGNVIRRLADAQRFNQSANNPKNAQNSFLRGMVPDLFQDQMKTESKEKMKRGGESVNEIKKAFVKEKEKTQIIQKQQSPFQVQSNNNNYGYQQQLMSQPQANYNSNNNNNNNSISNSSNNDENDDDDEDQNSDINVLNNKQNLQFNAIMANQTLPYYQQQEQQLHQNVQFELLNSQISHDIVDYILNQNYSIAEIKKEDMENYKRWLLSQEAQNTLATIAEPTENKQEVVQDQENDTLQIVNQTFINKNKITQSPQADKGLQQTSKVNKAELQLTENDKLTYKRVDEKPNNEVKDEDIFQNSFEEEEEEDEDGSNNDGASEDGDLNDSANQNLSQNNILQNDIKKIEKKDKIKIPFTGFQGFYENSFRYYMNEKIFYNAEKEHIHKTYKQVLQQEKSKKKINSNSLNPLQSRWEMLYDFFINKSHTYKNIEKSIKLGRIIKMKDPNKEKQVQQQAQTKQLQHQQSIKDEQDANNFQIEVSRSTKYFSKKYSSTANLDVENIFFEQHIQI